MKLHLKERYYLCKSIQAWIYVIKEIKKHKATIPYEDDETRQTLTEEMKKYESLVGHCFLTLIGVHPIDDCDWL